MNYILIGKLVATYGFRGEIILVHSLGKRTTLKGLKAIFLEDRKGSFIPWFIQSARIKSDKEIYLRLEGIDSREAATPVLQKEVWLTDEEFEKYAARTATAGMLGYEVIDNGRSLGTILELIEQPHQLLCRLEVNGKEVLIPLHEKSLNKIDRKKKQVFVDLPEGLLDVYLE